MTIKTRNTIVFDFGGTLDTNGIHWSHKFFQIYLSNNIIISFIDFIKAYVFAERNIGQFIKPEDSFFSTLNFKIKLQLQYLYESGILDSNIMYDQKKMVQECYNDVLAEAENSGRILSSLQKNFKLGIASNFYGNLHQVLDEFSLKQYFSYIFDSALEGIRKPDTEVFKRTIEKLGSTFERSVIIGDSYENDIQPGKDSGCTTIWLMHTPLNKPETTKADFIISSLNELPVLTASIQSTDFGINPVIKNRFK